MDLLAFMQRKGLNQRKLAEALDISTANMSKYVKGETHPSYEVCKKLFELGISVEELFGVQYLGYVQDPAQMLSPAEIVRRGLLELAALQQAEAAGREAMTKQYAQTQSQKTPGSEKK